MKQSESIKALSQALVEAQAEMPEIPMDGVNPHFRSKFSTLGAVIKHTRPVFAKHGLSVFQLPSGDENSIGVTTRIVHTSGEWIEEEARMAIPNGANPGQEFGKLITYLRRYSLAAAAGVYSDEDVDNEPAPRKASKPAKVTAPPVPSDRPYDAETVKEKVQARVQYHLDKQTTASVNERKVLASILDTVMKEPTRRYEMCKWLVGQSSTQKMKQADVMALYDWLGAEKMFNAPVEDYVKQEIEAAHKAALIASGQQELM